MQSVAFNKRNAFEGLGTVTIFILAYFIRFIGIIILALFIIFTLEKYVNY
jgi:hypothetical protein